MTTTNTADSFARLVRAEWNAVSTTDAWRRWHKKTVRHLQPMTQALLESAEIRSGSAVLDLASGSGEPAITIATIVGSEGHVTATDLSSDMLAIAEENTRDLDNMSFQQADAHDLPFADNSFDVVTSRLGIMYFWDCASALGEILRVLKPGGRAAFAVWGDLECNALARILIEPFAKRHKPPPLPPEAPHPFRFAESGSLAAELDSAGFTEVREQQHLIPCPWPGPPDELWAQLHDMAVPLQPYIDSFEPHERQQAVREVIEGYSEYYDGEITDPSTCIIVCAGCKPNS